MFEFISNLFKRDNSTSQISQNVVTEVIQLKNDFLVMQDSLNKVYSQLSRLNARGYMQEKRQAQPTEPPVMIVAGAPISHEMMAQLRGDR